MSSKMLFLNVYVGDFPGGQGAKTPSSQFREPRFDPWLGTTSHMLKLKSLHTTMKSEDPECYNQDLTQPNKKNFLI